MNAPVLGAKMTECIHIPNFKDGTSTSHTPNYSGKSGVLK